MSFGVWVLSLFAVALAGGIGYVVYRKNKKFIDSIDDVIEAKVKEIIHREIP